MQGRETPRTFSSDDDIRVESSAVPCMITYTPQHAVIGINDKDVSATASFVVCLT